MSASTSQSTGVGFGGALFLLFLGLKLCHVIDWSWWWVFAPLWMPLSFVVIVLAVLGLIVGVAALLDRKAGAS